ncbi:hypothetical protein BJ508DRAFT_331809 [Ascobolus immersus RN42]|uniref:Uncharacterized protein n=1 Tax=Ascobolus immersus RN42 TaxID=1160509 RepID=A0A3N4HPQ5_ASCIM|nr:hypothetical protein BJ508DRAFT_331809 [Ascobolus immersus RN42]
MTRVTKNTSSPRSRNALARQNMARRIAAELSDPVLLARVEIERRCQAATPHSGNNVSFIYIDDESDDEDATDKIDVGTEIRIAKEEGFVVAQVFDWNVSKYETVGFIDMLASAPAEKAALATLMPHHSIKGKVTRISRDGDGALFNFPGLNVPAFIPYQTTLIYRGAMIPTGRPRKDSEMETVPGFLFTRIDPKTKRLITHKAYIIKDYDSSADGYDTSHRMRGLLSGGHEIEIRMRWETYGFSQIEQAFTVRGQGIYFCTSCPNGTLTRPVEVVDLTSTSPPPDRSPISPPPPTSSAISRLLSITEPSPPTGHLRKSHPEANDQGPPPTAMQNFNIKQLLELALNTGRHTDSPVHPANMDQTIEHQTRQPVQRPISRPGYEQHAHHREHINGSTATSQPLTQDALRQLQHVQQQQRWPYQTNSNQSPFLDWTPLPPGSKPWQTPSVVSDKGKDEKRERERLAQQNEIRNMRFPSITSAGRR